VEMIVAQTFHPFCHTFSGGWFGWSVHLLWWALVIGLVVWAVAYVSRRGSGDLTALTHRVLADRYARGELSTEEYLDRRGALR
jgi:putative membrane protein